MIKKELFVNGVARRLVVDGEDNLARVLRANLGLTGTKVGCGEGQCGACSVLMDGKVVRSCATKMKRVPDGARVTTIEGIGSADCLHPLQLAWMVQPSVGSVRLVSSSPPKDFSTVILRQAGMRCVTGSRNIVMPAAVPAIFPWWMRPWMLPGCCAVN